MNSPRGPLPEPPASFVPNEVPAAPAAGAPSAPACPTGYAAPSSASPIGYAPSAPVPPAAAAPANPARSVAPESAPAASVCAAAAVAVPAPAAAPTTAYAVPASPANYVAPAPAQGQGVEACIGRTVISIVASILVFMGVILLGVTMIPMFDNIAKVAIMFSLSGALAVTGGVLSAVKRNGFTTALMGCGMGSLFISVFVTHLYFGLMGEIPAYALIMVWMALCLVLVWKTDSLLMEIVLQLGFACSVFLGCFAGVDVAKLPVLVGYQMAASAIVVVGNMLVCRRLYRTSLFMALGLSVFVALCLWWQFIFATTGLSLMPVGWLVTLFLVQFATTFALAVLVFGSIHAECVQAPSAQDRARLEGKWRLQVVSVVFAVAVAARVDLVSVLGRCLRAGMLDANLHRQTYMLTTGIAYAVAVAVFALAMVLLVAFGRSVAKSDQVAAAGPGLKRDASVSVCMWGLVKLAVALVLGFQAFTLFVFSVDVLFTSDYCFAWLWVSALCAIALRHATGVRGYYTVALVLLGVDVMCMTFIGFPVLGMECDVPTAVALGAAYSVGLILAVGLLLHAMKAGSVGGVLFAVGCTALALSFASSCTPWVDFGYGWSICCMVCALACVIVGFATKMGGLRLYGLILVLLSVLKLVTLDLFDLDPMARVLGLIVGGLICFAISAVYSFAVKSLRTA